MCVGEQSCNSSAVSGLGPAARCKLNVTRTRHKEHPAAILLLLLLLLLLSEMTRLLSQARPQFGCQPHPALAW